MIRALYLSLTVVILVAASPLSLRAELVLDEVCKTLGRLETTMEAVPAWGDGFGKDTQILISPTQLLRGALTLDGCNENADPVGVGLSGTTAYIACRDGSVHRVNVSNPVQPEEEGTVNIQDASPRSASDIEVFGTIAYIRRDSDTWEAISLDEPAASLGTFPLRGVLDIAVVGTHMYAAAGQDGLRVYDITQPENPVLKDTLPLVDAFARQVACDGNTLYLYTGSSRVQVYDIKDPVQPKATDQVVSTGGSVDQLAALNDTLLFTPLDPPTGIRIIRVKPTFLPESIGSIDAAIGSRLTANNATLCIVKGNQLTVVGLQGDLLNTQPGTLDTPGAALDLALHDGTTVVVADGDGGVQVVDASDPKNLEFAFDLEDLPGKAVGLAVYEDEVYVAYNTSTSGYLRKIDLNGQDEVQDTLLPGEALSIALAPGSRLFVGYGTTEYGGLWVQDISNPTNEAVTYDGLSNPLDIAFDGDAEVAYIADGFSGLRRLNIQGDTITPLGDRVGCAPIFRDPEARGIAVLGDRAYMAVHNHDSISGLQIVDLSTDPPTSTAHLLTEDVYDVEVARDGSVEVAYLSAGKGGLIAVDVGDPQQVQTMGTIDTLGEIRKSVLFEDRFYLANGASGVSVVARPVVVSPNRDSNDAIREDKIFFDIPSPALAGDYSIRVFNADSHAEIPGAVTFSEDAQLFRSKAILVAGGGPKASGGNWVETKRAVELAYHALIQQGYDDENIRYYRVADEGGQEKLAGAPSFIDIEQSVTNWAADDADDLLIYLVGHGEPGKMILMDHPNSGVTRLDVINLAEWLDDLQRIPGYSVTLIYDGCYSGSFIPPLRNPEAARRVVITSAPAYKEAVFPNLGSDSFSGHFWNSIHTQGNLLKAYEAARIALEGTQKPMLDANGDGRSDNRDNNLIRDHIVLRGWPEWVVPPTIGSLSVDSVPDDDDALAISALNVAGADDVYAHVLSPASEPAIIPLSPVGEGNYAGVYGVLRVNGTYSVSVRAEKIPASPSTSCAGGGTARIVPIYSKRLVEYVTRRSAAVDPGMDTYEGDDKRQLADAITVDGDIPQVHTFHSLDDVDWVKFYGIADERYTIVTSELPACDTELALFRADGSDLRFSMKTETDDNGIAVKRYLDFPCEENGVYALKVTNGNSHFGWNARYDISVYKPEAPSICFTIWGDIFDPQGTPIAGVVVTTDDGASDLSRLNPRGEFRLRIQAGPCEIHFEREGYESRSIPIEVVPRKENYLAVTLKPGDSPGPKLPRSSGGGSSAGCFLSIR